MEIGQRNWMYLRVQDNYYYFLASSVVSNFKITLSGEIMQISMTLPKGYGQKASTSGKRSFEDWWRTVPDDLRSKSRKGDEANKPLLNQVNYVLLHLHLAGKHDAKPSHEELKDWLHSGQVDVLRMNAAKK
jgi:hypothetical protein